MHSSSCWQKLTGPASRFNIKLGPAKLTPGTVDANDVNVIPHPLNYQVAAAITNSIFCLVTGHITQIHETQPGFPADIVGFF
jgi:hypothetical protein